MSRWSRVLALAVAAGLAVPAVATGSPAFPAGPPALSAAMPAGHSALPAGHAALPAGHAAACGQPVSDPLAEAPWPQTRLRPDLAWPLTTGAGVIVAVIDSGVSADHAALSGKVLPGTDFVTPSPGNCDENGHGTLIAGLIAGRPDVSNGFPFHGVAPGASIVPVRVLRDQSRTFDDEMPAIIAAAVRWAVDVGGADVINMSLTTLHTPQLQSAIQYALDRGVVVVAAAGNEGGSQPGEPVYPAAYEGVIAVAGVDRDDKHVGSSTTGSYVDISAPGVRIAGPSPAGGGYLFSEQGGTSYAAGYVSGVAALIRAYDPSLNPQEVAQRMMDTADHPAEIWNRSVGYGVVNPVRAVGSLKPSKAPDGIDPERHLAVPPPPEDPLRTVTFIASMIAIAGAGTVIAIILGVAAVRLGRRRGWQSTRSGPWK